MFSSVSFSSISLATLTAVQPEPEQPKGLRRADVAPTAPITVPEPQQLQQVETHHS